MKITNTKVTVKMRNDVCQTPLGNLSIEEAVRG